MLRNLFCIVFTAVWTVFLCVFGIAHALLARRSPFVTFLASRVWSPGLLWAGGVQLKVEGLENIPPNRAVVFVSNHQSSADIPALLSVLPLNVRFIAKHVLGYVPFLGWYLYFSGFILINRSKRPKAIRQLNHAIERIRAGTSIVVFPEGTRSPNGEIFPFKKGAFVLALKAGVPICPIAIEGFSKLMPKNSWDIHPGPVYVKIGPPIDTVAYGDEPLQLANDVRNLIVQQNLALGGKGASPETPPPPAPSPPSP
ncbi:MAG: 1-acyl-sn-glycerol-3-phosphate acyltransferase [Cystobacterineae bacterium]|nr:1-acyl-sn-glycerol-3-phosphate acyltransferase [Cystobacterineae bacterium]